MKLQFDATQEYQLEAVRAITDLFKGQPLNKGDFEMKLSLPEDQLQIGNEFVVGNNLVLAEETMLKNLQVIQGERDLKESKELDGKHFSVEMETGTGKTYVYLRTIHELCKQYGFKKFVIVVPSIAIKEGVLKNLKITQEHFSMLYGNPEMDFYLYDPKKRGLLKNFATTNALQVLVINIDSFAKYSEDNKGKNIIYKNSDWGIPIEYIQGVKPIVIVDEPQNMETDIRKKAIDNLNPLCTLRYSATHKYHYNLVHKLDPVSAYDLGLVKKIEVDSVITEESHNGAYVELKSVDAKKTKVTAKMQIDVADKSGVSKKIVTFKVGDDLFEVSGQRDIYKDGYIINEIDVAGQAVTFSNGTMLYVGQTQGGLNDEVMKFQIKKTVQNHFEKEKRLKERDIKVLSLFFIDRVANYRDYQDGKALNGKFAEWFEEAFNEMIQNPMYKDLIPHDVAKVHNGYFSADKKGILKDTKGNTSFDDDTYALIMKDKERLLSIDEPLRFIFSHSALREGWDNPNVFQICTLNESRSDMKKRQEIGRGLRLPVNQEGVRVFDDNINILTVTANESYEDFARSLQTEIEQDCGVDFKGRVKDKAKRTTVKLKKAYQLDENFKDLWKKIQHKTRYQVEYETSELIKKASKELEGMSITAPKIMSLKAKLDITREGVETELTSVREKRVDVQITSIPDILGNIQGKTRLTKDTILKIIEASGRVSNIFKNPQQFMDNASTLINAVLRKMMVDGIKYEKIAGEVWEMRQFENEELEGYLDSMFKVNESDKTLYDYIVCDSQIESQFAKDLETNEDVKFYIKLPYWFKIETPIGSYNPDWAVVFEADKRVYFVAESKGTTNLEELRELERMKIKCGSKHFEEFDDVEFKAPVSKVREMITQ
ncbi:MAG: DEAD/DEAH box helicase family protein [Candidatus Peregrinibacteria bacterium]|nr:DEAD/DEAH box helicase family protein [Candidatus Peregrinibacteria bacterium]MDZ4244892.1 DEAD/DEAH box helicase family protein [Candidatus Gracilibacteria bacterium]